VWVECLPYASRQEAVRGWSCADINLDNAKEAVREIESGGGTAIAGRTELSDVSAAAAAGPSMIAAAA